MFHRSEKAIRYAKELDDARLNGQYQLVPTLARKLQKHDHQKQCTLSTFFWAGIDIRLGKIGGLRESITRP